MKAQLVRIGNSRGVRIPQKVLALYEIAEGDEFSLEERREGILLRPEKANDTKISWDAAYAEMAAEAAEAAEWADWDVTADDGAYD